MLKEALRKFPKMKNIDIFHYMKRSIILLCLFTCTQALAKPCKSCNGIGSKHETITCEVCQGKGYTTYGKVIKCIKCSKTKTQTIAIDGRVIQVGIGEYSKKVKCADCNGSGKIEDAVDKMKVVTLTREELDKIVKLLELNGSVVLKKSSLKIELKGDK